MFTCPGCNTEIPRAKALILNKNSIITCKTCGKLLKPDQQSTRRTAMFGGLLSGLVSATGYILAGISGLLLSVVVGFALITIITLKTTSLCEIK